MSIAPTIQIANTFKDAAPRKRILLVRDGDFFIYVHQLADLLSKNGHEVEVLNTNNGEPEPLYRDLIEKTLRLNVKCHFVQNRACWIERKLIALAFRLRLVTKLGAMTPYKIRTSRKALANGKKYDCIIAYDPPSLFLACNLFPSDLGKIIDYSLEISDESHRDFQTSRTERSFRHFERSVLPTLRALMIQDRFRAQVLLRNVPDSGKVKTIFFPVVMSGPAFHKKRRSPSNFTAPPLERREVKILFFGGLWSRDLLRELEVISGQLGEGQVLVIHGGRGTVHPAQVGSKKLIISTSRIPFDQVNEFIVSADIGLAIYPNEDSNSRCSAFSSEKVARYLQCGIPFIAFHNEDYAYLQSETGCCELVKTYSEIPRAVNTILDNYDSYHRGACEAFEKFYRLERTGLALLREIDEECAMAATHLSEGNDRRDPTAVCGIAPTGSDQP